jgi:hypothetical protein
MTVEITLQCGRATLISDIDEERVRRHKWRSDEHNASGKPYVKATIAGRTVYLHRFIVHRPPDILLPATMRVDHRDTDVLNNRRGNLRVASPYDNNLNRRGFGISGFKGVTIRHRRFRARITKDGEEIHLGFFDRADEAARAYDKAAYELFGEFAWLNFPDEWPHTVDRQPEEIPFP